MDRMRPVYTIDTRSPLLRRLGRKTPAQLFLMAMGYPLLFMFWVLCAFVIYECW
jgi:uncharacterized membrane protein